MDNSPKHGRWYCASQRSLGETPEVYRYRRYICAGKRSELTRGEDRLQVCACGYEGCNIRNPYADAVQIGLEVYRQHIAVTTPWDGTHGWRQQTTAMHCWERRDGHLDLDL